MIENNNSRKESNLRGHLDEKNSENDTNEINNKSEIDETDTKSVNDYQLNRAIDLLKSISVYDNLKKAS